MGQDPRAEAIRRIQSSPGSKYIDIPIAPRFAESCCAPHPRVNEVCRLAPGHPGEHHEPLAGSWTSAGEQAARLSTALNAVAMERAERNRIARECAEATQERDQLRELVARMRPVVDAAIAEDITEELADQPAAELNRLIADELRDARDERRRAVRVWHDLAAGDVAEGRAPLGDVG